MPVNHVSGETSRSDDTSFRKTMASGQKRMDFELPAEYQQHPPPPPRRALLIFQAKPGEDLPHRKLEPAGLLSFLAYSNLQPKKPQSP